MDELSVCNVKDSAALWSICQSTVLVSCFLTVLIHFIPAHAEGRCSNTATNNNANNLAKNH